MEKMLEFTPRDLERKGQLRDGNGTYLMLGLSNLCNLRCIKCCNSFGYVPRPVDRLLSLEETLDIIADANNFLGCRVVVFPGEGEPLLIPGFRNVIEYVNNLGLGSLLFTNGTLLDADYAKFLKENNTSIIFSIDSLKKDSYNYLTGSYLYDTMMKNVIKCSEIYAGSTRIENGVQTYKLAVNAVINSLNIDELSDIKQFCDDNGIMFICNYPMKEGNAKRFENSLIVSDEDYKRFMDVCFEVSENHGFSGTTDKGECGYANFGLSILCDGKIALPCAYAPQYVGHFEHYNTSSLLRKYLGVQKCLKEHSAEKGLEIRRCYIRHGFDEFRKKYLE